MGRFSTRMFGSLPTLVVFLNLKYTGPAIHFPVVGIQGGGHKSGISY